MFNAKIIVAAVCLSVAGATRAAGSVELPSPPPPPPASAESSAGTGDAGYLMDEWTQSLQRMEEEQRALQDGLNDPHWQHGPAVVALKGPATLNLPAGFKFLPKESWIHFARKAGVEGSESKALIASESNDLLIDIEVEQIGHFSQQALVTNPKEILEKVNAINRPMLVRIPSDGSIPSVNHGTAMWIKEPAIQQGVHALSWAYVLPNGISRVQSLRLGRTWAVAFDAAPGGAPTTAVDAVATLASAISFAAGEDYVDNAANAPISQTSLNDLIEGAPSREYEMIMNSIAAHEPRAWSEDPAFGRRVLIPLAILICGLMGAAYRGSVRQSELEPKPMQQQADKE